MTSCSNAAGLSERTCARASDSTSARLACSAFEQLVIDLLVAMGYGTAEAAERTGRSGDEGIDGIIHRDALGLDRVYLQAKRYTGNAVGPEAINAFYGALQRKRADRGVFITSST